MNSKRKIRNVKRATWNVAAIVLTLIAGSQAWAAASDSPVARFEAANAAYKEQKYEAALQGYEGLI